MNTPFLSSDEYDERAHELYDAARFPEALEVLREGIGRFPEAVELHIGLAYVRVAREEYVWARKAFETALRLDPDHEDALLGLGETLLRFGEFEAGLGCFDRLDELGFQAEPEIGIAMGRALYREGLFEDSRARFELLAEAHPASAEAVAGYGAALHASGDPDRAATVISSALRLDPGQYEAWVHLGHIFADRGETAAALRAFARVPPAAHWDAWTLERMLGLIGNAGEESEIERSAYEARLQELRGADLDPIDRLLLEIEMDADVSGATPEVTGRRDVHRVRTADGRLFVGTWDEIVLRMRDEHAEDAESISDFMRRASERVRKLTGRELPCHDPEAFVRASERLGLLRIETCVRTPPMDSLDRLYAHLVAVLRRAGVSGSTHECTIAEIYQTLVPYRAVRSDLGFSELPRYEHTLLRLLAGERSYVAVGLPQVQEEFRTELQSGNPILGVYRDYAAVGVTVTLREVDAPPRAAEGEATPSPAPSDGPSTDGRRRDPPSQPPPPTAGRGSASAPAGDSACPHCAESLPRGRDARFCPFCGAGIRPAPCPECGEEIEPSWRFCMGCGHPSPLPGRR